MQTIFAHASVYRCTAKRKICIAARSAQTSALDRVQFQFLRGSNMQNSENKKKENKKRKQKNVEMWKNAN